MWEVLIMGNNNKKALISISALLICTDGWTGGNIQKEKIDPEYTLETFFHPNRSCQIRKIADAAV